MKPRIPKTLALSLINDENGQTIRSVPLNLSWDQDATKEHLTDA